MAKLTLYTDQGAEYSISSSNEDLTNLGYGTFTSCQSQGGRWIVYKNTQYNRPDSSRTVENQPCDIQVVSPGPLMMLNPITSAYLIPDSRETAIFFYDNYYGGPRQDSSTSIFDLNLAPPDGVSSSIINGGTWEMYSKPNFEGPHFRKTQGDYPTPDSLGVPNDTIRSVKNLD